MIESLGWEWVFWCVVPPAALAALGCWLWLPAVVQRQQHGGALTPIPLVLFGIGVICLQLALSEARFDFFAYRAHIVTWLAVGVGLLAYFVWHQYRHPSPVLVLRGLANPVYLTGLCFIFCITFFPTSATTCSRFMPSARTACRWRPRACSVRLLR